MTIFMAADVRTTLGPEADRCTSRNLLAGKFPDLPENDGDKESKKRSLGRMMRTAGDDSGRNCRITFLTNLRNAGRSYACIFATLKGRLIVNQAGGVLENAGLCLDRHFGCPFIPGSAVKGLARAAASATHANPAEILAVFGSSPDKDLPGALKDSGFSGSVAFLPAYPTSDAALTVDILTCHHQEYYRNETISMALDTEAPVPSPFPVVEAGADFLFVMQMAVPPIRLERIKAALGLPADFDPVARARNWLACGLAEQGIGAKTSAGYGWFEINTEAERKLAEEARLRSLAEQAEKARQDAELQRLENEKIRLASMTPIERARESLLAIGDEEFAAFAKTLGERTDDEQRAFLRILRVEKKDRWRVWKKKKPQLAASITAVAGKLGEVLP